MERSFAEAGRYGFKRARWRGRERVRIQDYLIAAAQNIRLLVTHGKPKPAAAGTVGRLYGVNTVILSLRHIFRSQCFHLPDIVQASPRGVAIRPPMTVWATGRCLLTFCVRTPNKVTKRDMTTLSARLSFSRANYIDLFFTTGSPLYWLFNRNGTWYTAGAGPPHRWPSA